MLLLAEDDPTDVLLLRRALDQAEFPGPVTVCHDGEALTQYLEGEIACPNFSPPTLVVLDLKMPRRNGLQTLEWIRAHPRLRHVPVIIFSASARRIDVQSAYALGANAFLVKPASLAARAEIARFLCDWMRLNQPVFLDPASAS